MITKNIKHNLAVLAMGCGVAFTTAGCNDFLDVLPMNDVVLENYWTKDVWDCGVRYALIISGWETRRHRIWSRC